MGGKESPESNIIRRFKNKNLPSSFSYGYRKNVTLLKSEHLSVKLKDWIGEKRD